MRLRRFPPSWPHHWGPLAALTSALMCASIAPASAQPPKPRKPEAKTSKPEAKPPKPEPKTDAKVDPKPDPKKRAAAPEKVKTFDFDALDLNGRMRAPQLLYFLERANEELERASLEKRSFVPRLVRSLEDESL
jgi:outer membrane biosynthesis protein TonB